MNAPTTPTANLELRDIHLPDAISWWPPAPGWWILLVSLLTLLLAAYIIRRIYRSKALHRNVISEITNIKEAFNKNNNSHALLQSLSTLLRRSCISFYPRHETAGLTGESWLRYLDSTYPTNQSSINHPFSEGVGKVLANAPYMAKDNVIDIDTTALIQICETWLQAQPVKNHSGTVN